MVGLTYTPPFTKAALAEVISFNVNCEAPSAMDGTAGIFDSMPKARASWITRSGPNSLISLAEMVFIELAKAYSSVTTSPYSKSLLSGHQSGWSPGISTQMRWLGNSVHRSMP